MCIKDWERAVAERLHWEEKQGVDTKIKVLTREAELDILSKGMNTDEEWNRSTPDLENHIDGKVHVRKDKRPGCEHRELPKE